MKKFNLYLINHGRLDAEGVMLTRLSEEGARQAEMIGTWFKDGVFTLHTGSNNPMFDSSKLILEKAEVFTNIEVSEWLDYTPLFNHDQVAWKIKGTEHLTREMSSSHLGMVKSAQDAFEIATRYNEVLEGVSELLLQYGLEGKGHIWNTSELEEGTTLVVTDAGTILILLSVLLFIPLPAAFSCMHHDEGGITKLVLNIGEDGKACFKAEYVNRLVTQPQI